MIKSFNNWSKLGYKIKKGSKCVKKTKDGQALFTDKQVIKIHRTSHNQWNSADDFNTSGGPMYGIYGNCD